MRAPSPRLILVCLLALHAGCGGCGNDGMLGDGGPGDDVVDARIEPDAITCTGGTLCGEPARCCAAGNECVDDACLPTCDTGIRCGDDLTICCDAGTVCLTGACVVPGEACEDSYDCEPGEFCEPTLDQCLPQPDPLTCEYEPVFDTLTVVEEWTYTASEIISIPVVANLDGDGAPEVVLNLTQQDGGGFPGGRIAVLDGALGGVELAPIPHAPPTTYGSHGRSTIAVGDVSGDGLPDIVYASRVDGTFKSLIVAIDRTGALLWRSHAANNADYRFTIENAAITLANFDGDDAAEVVIGAALIDDDGLVVWDQGGNGAGPTYGTNNGYTGGISAVADLDDDDVPEIVSGRNAWKVAWTDGAPPTVVVTDYWTYAGNDGYPAIADLDQNGTPEVVLVASSEVIVLNGQTGVEQTAVAIPGGTTSNRGGPPTIADFDADARPEIAVAGGYSYSLYDLNRPGEDVEQPDGDPPPAPGAIFVRWTQPTQDLSSNASGSSVFDFQGDGVAEVIYADECNMRVYRGTDGAVELDIENTTGTIHEYPLVVDVDGDGNSEILIVANDTNAGGDCPGQPARQGLFVYGDANDEWVPTRKVWTQHAYHVTNATSAGNVPPLEEDNWLQPGLNNYRQNVQGDGIFNAPDLAVTLSAGLDACETGELELRARVTNLGALGVPQGVEVTFYEGTDATGTLLGTGVTVAPLLPGQSEVVRLTVPAPISDTDYFVAVDTAGGGGNVIECDETNNGDTLTEAGCIEVD
jgi:hypothetical protein